MQRSSEIHRIALLLTGLGSEIAEPALACLEQEKAVQVRSELESLSSNPPGPDALNDVMDDFEMFLKFALRTANAPTSWNDEDFSVHEPATGSDVDNATDPNQPQLKIFQPSDDPISDLQRLAPAQIAGALANELPKTIGLVLSCLDNSTTALVLDALPPEVQPDAFFALQQTSNVSPDLLVRVARTTVEKGALIEPAKIELPDVDQKTADLLRALPKKTRNRLMEQLEQSDPEMAKRLEDLLYIFDDIILYDDRSVQKLLGQFDTQALITALQDVDPEVSQRIFNNLSKRAASALNEELEFKQPSTDTEVEEARKSIAGLIAQLDRAGELNELS